MSNPTSYYIEHLMLMYKSLVRPDRKRFYVDLGMHLLTQDAIIQAQSRQLRDILQRQSGETTCREELPVAS